MYVYSIVVGVSTTVPKPNPTRSCCPKRNSEMDCPFRFQTCRPWAASLPAWGRALRRSRRLCTRCSTAAASRRPTHRSAGLSQLRTCMCYDDARQAKAQLILAYSRCLARPAQPEQHLASWSGGALRAWIQRIIWRCGARGVILIDGARLHSVR